MKSFSLVCTLSFSILLAGTAAHAQDTKAYLQEDIERTAGYFHHYEMAEGPETASHPEGYEAFYISHFGRHGCRWHTSDKIYTQTLELLQEAQEKQLLTPSGETFLQKMEILAADAEGRLGDLSPRGEKEHRGIAERMFHRYPEVFQPGAQIDSRSTRVIRCILSMAAFDERLKELEPELQISRESSEKGCAFFSDTLRNRYSPEKHQVMDSLRAARLDEHRFMASIFKDGGNFMSGRLEYPEEFMFRSFELASIAQCNDYLGLDFYDLFTEEECWNLWKCINANAYVNMGPAYKFGDTKIENAKPLLRNIIAEADRVISGESELSASLRFGHDGNIIPLLALMGVEEADIRVPVEQAHECWNITEVSPMATNLQLIFFKNDTGNIKVRVLFRERDAKLPLEGGPFYDWGALRSYLENRLQRSYYFNSVDVETFRKIIQANEAVVIDVRTPAEHQEGCIPGTDLNIDVKSKDFAEKIRKEIPSGSKVAVYCRSGRRSKAASKILCDNGFEVIELASGYNGWSAEQK